MNPALPPDLRIYAIGDIHGRLDLLKSLREKILKDAESTDSKVQFILLGDYVDRGLYSREVIDYLITWKAENNPPIFLLGNHELVMRSILNRKDESLLNDWLQFGGGETLMSYGLKPSDMNGNRAALIKIFAKRTPSSHREFLNNLQLSASFGDYFFCHAGVEPGVSLDEQKEEVLVWIRRGFIDNRTKHAKIIVHGHSISPKAEFRINRIGIDTGAYATGKLTALGLEGQKQWLIQTG